MVESHESTKSPLERTSFPDLVNTGKTVEVCPLLSERKDLEQQNRAMFSRHDIIKCCIFIKMECLYKSVYSDLFFTIILEKPTIAHQCWDQYHFCLTEDRAD